MNLLRPVGECPYGQEDQGRRVSLVLPFRRRPCARCGRLRRLLWHDAGLHPDGVCRRCDSELADEHLRALVPVVRALAEMLEGAGHG